MTHGKLVLETLSDERLKPGAEGIYEVTHPYKEHYTFRTKWT